MSPDDKAPPKGALEEAVSLFDELMSIVLRTTTGLGCNAEVVALHNRRQALEPRLAKRRDKPGEGPRGTVVTARRRDNQAKPREPEPQTFQHARHFALAPTAAPPPEPAEPRGDKEVTTRDARPSVRVSREYLQTVVLAVEPRCEEVAVGQRCVRVLCHLGAHYAQIDTLDPDNHFWWRNEASE